MVKYRLVPEKELLKILEVCNKYYALDNGGVDNWEWYGASLCDYLNEFIKDQKLDLECDWNYQTIAERDIDEFLGMEYD